MPRTKRKMVRILHPELFEKGKQAILKFEAEAVKQGIKKPEKLSDSKDQCDYAENVSRTLGRGRGPVPLLS